MYALVSMEAVCVVTLERQVVHGVLSLACRNAGHLALLVLAHLRIDAVRAGHLLGLDGLQACRVVGCQFVGKQCVVAGLLIELPAYGVVRQSDGIQVSQYPVQVLCLSIAGDTRHIRQVEIAVEVQQDSFVGEGLAAIRHLCRAAHVLLAHILEPFAAP